MSPLTKMFLIGLDKKKTNVTKKLFSSGVSRIQRFAYMHRFFSRSPSAVCLPLFFSHTAVSTAWVPVFTTASGRISASSALTFHHHHFGAVHVFFVHFFFGEFDSWLSFRGVWKILVVFVFFLIFRFFCLLAPLLRGGARYMEIIRLKFLGGGACCMEIIGLNFHSRIAQRSNGSHLKK